LLRASASGRRLGGDLSHLGPHWTWRPFTHADWHQPGTYCLYDYAALQHWALGLIRH